MAGKRSAKATAKIRPKRITAKQKVARKRNIAIARSHKKKAGGTKKMIRKGVNYPKAPLTRTQRKAKGLPTNAKEMAKIKRKSVGGGTDTKPTKAKTAKTGGDWKAKLGKEPKITAKPRTKEWESQAKASIKYSEAKSRAFRKEINQRQKANPKAAKEYSKITKQTNKLETKMMDRIMKNRKKKGIAGTETSWSGIRKAMTTSEGKKYNALNKRSRQLSKILFPD